VQEVLPEEKIARFILDSSHIGGQKERRRVKPAEFLPKDGKKSIYRISHPDLTEEEIWHIGEQHVLIPFREKNKQPHKTMKGRADLEASYVYEQNLCFDPNGDPHPRHANIVGWPNEKPEQLLKAIKLAERAIVREKT